MRNERERWRPFFRQLAATSAEIGDLIAAMAKW